MSELKDLVKSAPVRFLPLILMVDTSGSMEGEKIKAMNRAVREMLKEFCAGEIPSEIHVAVIAFGGDTARLHIPLQLAKQIQWGDMVADGGTPMGAAMILAAQLIEDRAVVPGSCFRPTVVLISDGLPGDNIEKGLAAFGGEKRAAKSQRFALAIGSDANPEMLARFTNPAGRVFQAHDAPQIVSFMRWVAMSVSIRSRSQKPNEPAQAPDPFDLSVFK